MAKKPSKATKELGAQIAETIQETFSDDAIFEHQPEAIVLKGKATFMHHLFKLKPAKMVRNNGFSEENPVIVEHEHCHIFHTCDSRGKPQVACTPIGGHHHSVETVDMGPGKQPRLKISPPKKWVIKFVRGKEVRTEVEVKVGGEVDAHVHDYEYIRSEQLIPRKPNVEAAKFEAQQAALHRPQIDGVVAGS